MKLAKFPEHCPHCEEKMIEDTWEIINMLENGNIEQNIIYPTWVCSKFCGYYIKM